ncbi:MAG: DUF4298 domain-containing protein [Oscillospiraceae bacterium]|nr:DUF4298 domain-containing protein [Oscillospiraceae bacterium]
MEHGNETAMRVARMEQYFDAVSEAWREHPDMLYSDEQLREMLCELTAYSDSGQWLADYECDERGEFPANLKRGVLSEDGLYNLLCEITKMMESPCGNLVNVLK